MHIEQGVDSDVPNEDQGVVTSNSHFHRWLLSLFKQPEQDLI